jgi:hypothetical protein
VDAGGAGQILHRNSAGGVALEQLDGGADGGEVDDEAARRLELVTESGTLDAWVVRVPVLQPRWWPSIDWIDTPHHFASDRGVRGRPRRAASPG